MSTALYVFTHDLRLNDNPALCAGLAFDRLHLMTVIEPRWFMPGLYDAVPVGRHRWRFFWDGLVELAGNIAEFNQHLEVRFGEWTHQVVQALDRTGARVLIIGRPVGAYERAQLTRVLNLRPEVKLIVEAPHTLFDADAAPWLTAGLPLQFAPFRRLAEALQPSAPLPRPQVLPAMASCRRPTLALPDWVPMMRVDETSAYLGGERAGWRHLQEYFDSGAAATYRQTRDALDGLRSSSHLSPWLSQGFVSAKSVWAQVRAFEAAHGRNESTEWHCFELLWREYFQWLALKLGPRLFAFHGIGKRRPLTSYYGRRLQAWRAGNTPFPLVNAILRELNATGFISNRARQIAASALVNELQVDWRYGAAWFEQQLIDYDVASNWGNWQYLAGVGVDPRGGRHFNLERQQQQYDPQGLYRRRWLGEQAERDTPAPLDAVDAADWPLGGIG